MRNDHEKNDLEKINLLSSLLSEKNNEVIKLVCVFLINIVNNSDIICKCLGKAKLLFKFLYY